MAAAYFAHPYYCPSRVSGTALVGRRAPARAVVLRQARGPQEPAGFFPDWERQVCELPGGRTAFLDWSFEAFVDGISGLEPARGGRGLFERFRPRSQPGPKQLYAHLSWAVPSVRDSGCLVFVFFLP